MKAPSNTQAIILGLLASALIITIGVVLDKHSRDVENFENRAEDTR